MSVGDPRPNIASAMQLVTSLAERLPEGDVEHHGRLSARELARACADEEGVPVAVDRFGQSIRQLLRERDEGARRQQQHGATAIERLLDAFEEHLLPELRRAGLV